MHTHACASSPPAGVEHTDCGGQCDARAGTGGQGAAIPCAARRKQRREAASRRAPQELVKVPAELLEGLVNLAGETSIFRGRVEQQVSDFGFP